ncbi:hypothetical protein VN97_g10757, partial [Penicillium thymicola]
ISNICVVGIASILPGRLPFESFSYNTLFRPLNAS